MRDHDEWCVCRDCLERDVVATEEPRTFAESGFRFDRELHRYYLNGKEIPSVSRVLELVGLRKEFNLAAELAARRGSNVHAYCELLDKGELEKYDLDEAVKPYLAEWCAAKAHLGIERFDLIETQAYAKLGGIWVAGTCDRKAGSLLIDIKTATQPRASKAYRLQTALYSLIFGADERLLVYLRGTGEFDPRSIRDGGALDWHHDKEDIEAAELACRFVGWRTRRCAGTAI